MPETATTESLLEDTVITDPLDQTQLDQTQYESIHFNHVQFLVSLQDTLQQHYDIEIPYCVSEFVCDNACHLQRITGNQIKYGATSEMLIYQQDGDNLDISLYLDNHLLDNIEDVQKNWASNAFDDGCVLLEGVSHFLYLVWNAHYDRQLSHLDLELQAEVDKFVFAVFDTGYDQSTDHLLTSLFEQVHYRSELTASLKYRYEKANELAHRYCTWLTNEFDLNWVNRKAGASRQLHAELARFYRLNGAAKQRHIAQLLH